MKTNRRIEPESRACERAAACSISKAKDRLACARLALALEAPKILSGDDEACGKFDAFAAQVAQRRLEMRASLAAQNSKVLKNLPLLTDVQPIHPKPKRGRPQKEYHMIARNLLKQIASLRIESPEEPLPEVHVPRVQRGRTRQDPLAHVSEDCRRFPSFSHKTFPLWWDCALGVMVAFEKNPKLRRFRANTESQQYMEKTLLNRQIPERGAAPAHAAVKDKTARIADSQRLAALKKVCRAEWSKCWPSVLLQTNKQRRAESGQEY